MTVSVILCEWSLSAPITEGLISLCPRNVELLSSTVRLRIHGNAGIKIIWCLPNKEMVGIYTGHTTGVLATLFSKPQSQSRTIINGGLAGLMLEQMIIPNIKTAQGRTELWCRVSTCYQSMPLLPNETVHLQREGTQSTLKVFQMNMFMTASGKVSLESMPPT